MNSATLSENMLPHSIEAEQAVLGAVLADSECLSKVIEQIDHEEFFYKKSHQLIFDSFLKLAERGENIDTITVAQYLSDQKNLEQIGGRSYLSALSEHAPIAANAEYYAKTVKTKATLRNMITAGNEIVSLAGKSEEELDALVDKAEQLIFDLAQSKTKESLTHIGNLVHRSWEILEEREANKGQLTGMDTGFYDLNALTAGLQKSDLIILAARPSMGKCLHKDSQIMLRDGSIKTIEELVQSKKAQLMSLDFDYKFKFTEASNFIDDGIKPVFEVKTRSGRKIKTTITHPFLTVEGWKKLGEIEAGTKIACPRVLNCFGNKKIPNEQSKILGYLIGDGSLCPTGKITLTNQSKKIQEDFIEAIKAFDPNLKTTIKEPKDRTSYVTVTKNQEFVVEQRKVFAESLTKVCKEVGINTTQLAVAGSCSLSTASNWLNGKTVPEKNTFSALETKFGTKNFLNLSLQQAQARQNQKSSLALWLDSMQLLKNAHGKFIPEIIFTAEKEQLATFLNRLFATDGWATVLSSGQAQIGFVSVSEKLVRQVQHLLLRFGILSDLVDKKVKYKDGYKASFQLNITHSESMEIFCKEIGIFSKEEKVAAVLAAVSTRRKQSNKDQIPKEIWKQIDRLKGSESYSKLATRAGIEASSNIHPHKRAPHRQRLKQLAIALGSEELENLAESDLFWDEIVSIDFVGEEQVYDLTVDKTHNFVANDLCVHNTAYALNVAENVAIKNRKAVALFSLEMSKDQLVQRMLCARAEVDATRVRTGQLTENDWARLGQAMSEIGEAPIFIDDSAGITIMEIRGKCRRLKAQQGELGLIVIDYLQLIEGRGSDSRINQISDISRGLKLLARELDVPVIALSQLSRAVESRNDKRPMLSDLRDSGSIEQDADIVMFIYRDEYYNPESEKAGIAEIMIAKQRNGPVGTIELLFQSNITKFKNPAQ